MNATLKLNQTCMTTLPFTAKGQR